MFEQELLIYLIIININLLIKYIKYGLLKVLRSKGLDASKILLLTRILSIQVSLGEICRLLKIVSGRSSVAIRGKTLSLAISAFMSCFSSS